MDRLAWPQLCLWRCGALPQRLDDPRPQAHDQDRGRSFARLRHCRARGHLSRSLQIPPGQEISVVARLHRSRLGQRARQHARAWHRLHALWRSRRPSMRHGGRARERRGVAHRARRHGRQPRLAALQICLWPDARRTFHAIEFRRRHQDRGLVDARAGILLRRRDDGAARGGYRAADRCAARVASRRHRAHRHHRQLDAHRRRQHHAKRMV